MRVHMPFDHILPSRDGSCYAVLLSMCVTFAVRLIANCKQWKNDWPRVCLLPWKKNATHALWVNWWKLIKFLVMDACFVRSHLWNRWWFGECGYYWQQSMTRVIQFIQYISRVVSQLPMPLADRPTRPLCCTDEVLRIKCDVDASAWLWKINVNATNGKLFSHLLFIVVWAMENQLNGTQNTCRIDCEHVWRIYHLLFLLQQWWL